MCDYGSPWSYVRGYGDIRECTGRWDKIHCTAIQGFIVVEVELTNRNSGSQQVSTTRGSRDIFTVEWRLGQAV